MGLAHDLKIILGPPIMFKDCEHPSQCLKYPESMGMQHIGKHGDAAYW